MKEHPILFSSPMVRAIVEGRKSQTRRVIKHPPSCPDCGTDCDPPQLMSTGYWTNGMGFNRKCPYGQAGDLLVPLCTWAVGRDHDEMKPTDLPHNVAVWSWWESEEKPGWCGKSRPGRFMPKTLRGWLPRLENKGVRAERLQEITLDDCVAEGVVYPENARSVANFAEGWDQLNAKRGYAWATNPWVWVVGFGRCGEEA